MYASYSVAERIDSSGFRCADLQIRHVGDPKPSSIADSSRSIGRYRRKTSQFALPRLDSLLDATKLALEIDAMLGTSHSEHPQTLLERPCRHFEPLLGHLGLIP